MGTKHMDQRVGVFVDVQNMYYSAKNLYNAKVNFKEILNDAVAGRKLIRAIGYVIKADVKDEMNFHDALKEIGFEVNIKELQIFYGGHKKGDWDVGIAMDIMKLASKLDVVVLVSGDGDFRELLEHCKALGCRAEVMAFGRTASSKIKEIATDFIDMDQNKKYLIPLKPGTRIMHHGNKHEHGRPGQSSEHRQHHTHNAQSTHITTHNVHHGEMNRDALPLHKQPLPRLEEKKAVEAIVAGERKEMKIGKLPVYDVEEEKRTKEKEEKDRKEKQIKEKETKEKEIKGKGKLKRIMSVFKKDNKE